MKLYILCEISTLSTAPLSSDNKRQLSERCCRIVDRNIEFNRSVTLREQRYLRGAVQDKITDKIVK